MANQIIPFDSEMKLPAHLQSLGSNDDWESGQVSGFPVISIKSKVFHIVRGEDKQLITRKDDPDEPASNISVVVLRTHKGVARTFYKTQYEEGSSEKPDCYSNDGIAPAADAESPQCKTCAACPHAQWGSRITENGKKGKACSEVKRLAVAAPGQINDPMLLRVPPTSLRTWDQYVDMLRKRGVTPAQVVTKISFDHSVSHQLLVFKPVGFINEQMAEEIADVRDDMMVLNIIGQGPNSGHAGDPPEAPATATATAPAGDDDDDDDEPEEKPEEKPKTTRRRKVVDDDEGEPEPPKKAKAKAKKEPEPDLEEEDEGEEEDGNDDLAAELEDMLGGLGLDDDDD